MNEFRDKLKIQNLLIAIGSSALACFSILAAINEMGIIHIMPATGDSHHASMWNGFICGATCGIMVVMIAILVRNILALRDEKKLKKLYIQVNDERYQMIWTYARASSMQAFLILGVVAGLIAGYFSIVVSLTIWACLFVHSMIGLAFKIYYSIKL